MRYRLAILGLAAGLGLLPGQTTTRAAPAPKRAKLPEIYSLIYVGLGKNDPDNAKRIATAPDFIRGSGSAGAVRDPKVKALPVVAVHDPQVKAIPIDQDPERKRTRIERDDWAKSKTRASTLEGTAVVRVWFTEGSPQEQVVIVNAIAHEYVKDMQNHTRGALEALERKKRDYVRNGGLLTKEVEREFRRQEEDIKNLPHVIEWASLPDKP